MATKAPAINEPETVALRIPNLPNKLTAGSAKLVAEFSSACRDFEAGLAAILDRHKTLFDHAAGLSLTQIQEQAAELQTAMEEAQARRIELAWQRREILPQLIGDYQTAVDAAQDHLQKSIEAELKSYASQGVDASAMAGGATAAGQRQLLKLTDKSVPIIAARRAAAVAVEALRALKNGMAPVPGRRGLLLTWPERAGEYSAAVNLVANFRTGGPPVCPDMGYQDIAVEVGLGGTILPDRYREPLLAIVELIGGIAQARKVLYAITNTRHADKVAGLIDQLPRTKEVVEIFARASMAEKPPRRKTPRIILKV